VLADHIKLRYADEVKAWSDVPPVKPGELGLAQQIIAQTSTTTFTPEKYKAEVRGQQ
jgi:non-homologous end joining protein Ku